MSNIEKKLDSIQRILKLAIEITNNTKADVFVDYSGHVNSISIRAYLQGWGVERNTDYSKDIYFNVFSENECEKELQETIKILEEVQKNEINSI